LKLSAVLLIAVGVLAFTGCGSKRQSKVAVPPPPPPATEEADSTSKVPFENTPTPKEDSELSIPADTKPLLVQTGRASWYGAPYHNRRGSNGEIYDMNAMTAAHRTLPLGSIVRVTNLNSGHSAIVRITDRGPFVEGRILDLSLAAARKVDVWQPGVAMVRLEVLKAPSALDVGGRWAVQIGAFEAEKQATSLASHLTRRYHTAKVQQFCSPIGDWWVRVRVLGDDRKRAEEVAHDIQTTQGSIFLVRLD